MEGEHYAKQSLLSLILEVVNPVLVMLQVGSLALFLLDVFYVGQYSGRLTFVTCMFVMATVLICRIAINMGIGRATVYAILLGIVSWKAINTFVGFPDLPWLFVRLINALIVVVVWFVAHKLTWNCTYVGDIEQVTSQGLLDSLETAAEKRLQGKYQNGPNTRGEAAKTDAEIDRTSRANTPGMWVLYFAFLAIPIFGLGQIISPAAGQEQQLWRFELMVVYLSSGFGLLMTTSLLNSYRYLCKRRCEPSFLPMVMWLVFGGATLVAILALGALLPRPGAAYRFARLDLRAVTGPTKASRFAFGKSAATSDRADSHKVAGQKQERRKTAQQQGEDHSTLSGQQQSAQGQRTTNRAPTPGKSQAKGEGGETSSRHAHDDTTAGASSGDSASAGFKGGSKQVKQLSGDKSGSSRSKDTATQHEPEDSVDSYPPDDERQEGRRRDTQPLSAEGTSPQSQPWLQFPRLSPTWFFMLLKLIFWGLLAAGVIWWLIRNRETVVGSFKLLFAFLGSLFNRWRLRRSDRRSEKEVARQMPLGPARRFTDFANPFLTGDVENWSPRRVVCYTFEALEAWAAERGLGRNKDETPMEFAQRIATSFPELLPAVKHLSSIYCRQAYASQPITVSDVEGLRDLWELLESLSRMQATTLPTADGP